MSYAGAAVISGKLLKGTVYATVTAGPYKGTIGQIDKVKAHHYAKHSYTLAFPGRTIKFCGSLLVECDPHAPVLICNEDYVPLYNDFNGREIEVGQRIIVSKRSTVNTGADMLVGNVRRIDSQGVWFAPFAINGAFTNETANLVKLCKSSTAMVLDGSTAHAIMIQKLSAGDIE